MEYKRLLFQCECGGYVVPHSLWLTDEKALCVTGMCVACGEVVNTLFTLTQLYKACPFPDVKKLSQMVDEAIEKITSSDDEDADFLHQCGIGGDV